MCLVVADTCKLAFVFASVCLSLLAFQRVIVCVQASCSSDKQDSASMGSMASVSCAPTVEHYGSVAGVGGTKTTDGRTDVTGSVSPDCVSFQRHLFFLQSTALIEGLVVGIVAMI